MKINVQPSRRLFIPLGGMVAAILLIGIILIPLWVSSARAFARTAEETCATAAQKTAALCNNQDPVQQGCVNDAHTTARADIIENGNVIGRLERRHSPTCHTYWGRVFDFRPQKRPVTIQLINVDIAADAWNDTEAFSNMVFVPNPQDLAPAMEGILALDNNDPLVNILKTNTISANLPSVPSREEA